MTKMGVVLDFKTQMLVIDKSIQPIKPLESLKDTNLLNNFHRDHLEPDSTCGSNKRTVEILDASYEKANLAEVLDKNCGHLSSIQQISMLKLLTKY